MDDKTLSTQEPQSSGKVSIIIPTYHTAQLGATLRALIAQKQFEQICEILVVGQQEMGDLLHLSKVRYIHMDVDPTPAHNRNIGARLAQATWLCFLDSDCVAEPDWLSAILAMIERGVPVIAGAVRVPDSASYWELCDNLFAFENVLAGHSKEHPLTWAPSLNLTVRREIFWEMNGFDENFKSAAGEDRDLCWRLQQANYKILFTPHAIVTHYHTRSSLKATWQHIYRYGQATTQFRLGQGSSLRWQLGAALVQFPILGELAGMIRVLGRMLLRPIKKPSYISRYWVALPGMIVLDCALTLGMIHALKEAVRLKNSVAYGA